MAEVQIRQWQDPARNKVVTVLYYDETPRRLQALVEPLDPAFPARAGGSPQDGIALGSEITRFCENGTLLVFKASNIQPYATLQATDDAPACDLSTLAIVRATGFAPVSPATTGTAEVQGSGGVLPYTVIVDGITVTSNAAGLATIAGLAPGAKVATLNDADSPPRSRQASFVVPGTDAPGCNLPTALNYNPSATSNDGSCVFVALDEEPTGLLAAHLPVPVTLRSAPINGVPALVALFLETAPTTAGPWAAAGSLFQEADPVTAAAAFNVSELLKAQLRIQPPVESGTDGALSVLARLRYEVRSDTGVAMYAGTLKPFRALNATVAPPAGGVLTTPTPYTEKPSTANVWHNTATLAGGVTAATVNLPASGCAPRQFVWLNRLGGWDTGFFFGRHQHGEDQADPSAYRDSTGADRYASRGTVRDTLQVYSDKVDWPTYQAMYGIRRSVQVYERIGANQYVPVLVTSGSFAQYQEQTSKTFEVNFTISYPAVLIQTQ